MRLGTIPWPYGLPVKMPNIIRKSKAQLIDELARAQNRIVELERLFTGQQLEVVAAQFQNRLIEQIHDSVIITDLNGIISCWNQGSGKLFGYSTQEALGKHIDFIFENASPNFFNQKVIQPLETSDYHILETKMIKKAGGIFTAHLSTSLIPDTENNSVSILCYLTDISRIAMAEQKMAEISRFTKLVMNSTCEGIYCIDTNGNTTFVNSAAAEMTGWGIADLIGKPTHEMIHHTMADGKPYPVEECPIMGALTDNQNQNIMNEIFWRKDGSWFPIRCISKPIQDGQGKTMGAVITFQESTEHIETEKTLRQMARKLKQQTNLLNRKNLAMRELFRLAETEKKALKAQISINVDTFLMPMITTIKSTARTDEDCFYLGLLEEGLLNITSGFGHNLLRENSSLTSREVEISNMIKSGLNSKTIASVLHLSIKTINAHRANIRRKLGILGKKVNLETYIRAL